MWYDLLDNNIYITKLYNKVPNLVDIKINEMNILEEGDKVRIVFDLSSYADNPPKKWIQSEYNTTVVEIDLFEIQEINMFSMSKNIYKSDINIWRDNDNYISVDIKGRFNESIKAIVGMIQSISGYCNQCKL